MLSFWKNIKPTTEPISKIYIADDLIYLKERSGKCVISNIKTSKIINTIQLRGKKIASNGKCIYTFDKEKGDIDMIYPENKHLFSVKTKIEQCEFEIYGEKFLIKDRKNSKIYSYTGELLVTTYEEVIYLTEKYIYHAIGSQRTSSVYIYICNYKGEILSSNVMEKSYMDEMECGYDKILIIGEYLFVKFNSQIYRFRASNLEVLNENITREQLWKLRKCISYKMHKMDKYLVALIHYRYNHVDSHIIKIIDSESLEIVKRYRFPYPEYGYIDLNWTKCTDRYLYFHTGYEIKCYMSKKYQKILTSSYLSLLKRNIPKPIAKEIISMI